MTAAKKNGHKKAHLIAKYLKNRLKKKKGEANAAREGELVMHANELNELQAFDLQ